MILNRISEIEVKDFPNRIIVCIHNHFPFKSREMWTGPTSQEERLNILYVLISTFVSKIYREISNLFICIFSKCDYDLDLSVSLGRTENTYIREHKSSLNKYFSYLLYRSIIWMRQKSNCRKSLSSHPSPVHSSPLRTQGLAHLFRNILRHIPVCIL